MKIHTDKEYARRYRELEHCTDPARVEVLFAALKEYGERVAWQQQRGQKRAGGKRAPARVPNLPPKRGL